MTLLNPRKAVVHKNITFLIAPFSRYHLLTCPLRIKALVSIRIDIDLRNDLLTTTILKIAVQTDRYECFSTGVRVSARHRRRVSSLSLVHTRGFIC